MGDMLKLEHSQIFEIAARLNQLTDPLNEHEATVRLLGNLPFGVASPLLIQWLKMMALRQGLFRSNNRATMTLMFQKEVAESICAPPSNPQRSRLSVMAQSICDVKLVYKLSASVFVPKPKVDAAVVHFEPKASPLVPGMLIVLPHSSPSFIVCHPAQRGGLFPRGFYTLTHTCSQKNKWPNPN